MPEFEASLYHVCAREAEPELATEQAPNRRSHNATYGPAHRADLLAQLLILRAQARSLAPFLGEQRAHLDPLCLELAQHLDVL